ncbi:MAG: hypothetical protein ACRDTR_14285 [Rubrobacter sp.]
MRRLAVLPLALSLLVLPDRALAHGLGQTYDLPVPFWLYFFGAAAAVLVSFVQVGVFVGEGDAVLGYPRFDLLRLGPLRALLGARLFLGGVRLVSVALLALVILSGLFGNQDPLDNFAPTFVWIVWWVGMGFFVAFVGNVWPLVNPWKILFEWADALSRRLGAERGLELAKTYPVWGVWPALALYAVFIWVELVYEGRAEPHNLAVLALCYSGVTWAGMVIFGKETWLRRGEAFSVFFGLLGRFAPTEARVTDPGLCDGCSGCCPTVGGECVNCYECFAKASPEDRELDLRLPSVGLARPEPVPPGGVIFVILVLAGVAYDGLQETPPWLELVRLTPLTQTSGLISLPLVFFVLYLGFVKLSQVMGGGVGGLRLFAAAYVYSLVPIAVVYQVAHYFSYLLVQGQAIIALASDPFGWGWDLFGTAGYGVNPDVIGADTVWYAQVALIVAGHVVAVYLAHLVALRLLEDRRKALLSQIPMLALMIFYTVFSLWILSQPSAG